MPIIAWFVFVAAALLEVGGDALVRQGLRRDRLMLIILGCLTLGGYGIMVNLVKWDFSQLLGVYVALFACVSVCWGRFVFQEQVPLSTWFGLGLIMLGGFVIQLSHGAR